MTEQTERTSTTGSVPSAHGLRGFSMENPGAAVARLEAVPSQRLYHGATPLEPMNRLRAALHASPRLLVKRDDAIPFGFGGNKVRKLERLLATALHEGADTLVTVGGVQSNHARATAAAAAKLGLGCVLIANGQRPVPATANALLADLLGADVRMIESRDERGSAIAHAVDELRGSGRRPFAIPLGASTPLGALGLASAVGELVARGCVPTAIVHASSSGGTQAGLVLGCLLYGLPTRVIGISSDEPAGVIRNEVRSIIAGAAALLGLDGDHIASACTIEVDDSCIGEGYGIPSAASVEAQQLAARCEALFVDHTYTAKGLAGMIGRVRAGEFREDDTVLFWHTGGQVGIFA